MTVLVTGVAGFIGSTLAERLVSMVRRSSVSTTSATTTTERSRSRIFHS